MACLFFLLTLWKCEGEAKDSTEHTAGKLMWVANMAEEVKQSFQIPERAFETLKFWIYATDYLLLNISRSVLISSKEAFTLMLSGNALDFKPKGVGHTDNSFVCSNFILSITLELMTHCIIPPTLAPQSV